MKNINLIQGTAQWHAHRANHFNASDAPAMLGCSPYTSRTDLLVRLKTGYTPEVNEETQRRFADGHRFEALARPLAEAIMGQELFPVTGIRDKYSASFDGLTMAEDVAWEHKTLNQELKRCIGREHATASDLPLHYRIQMEHQCLVAGCSAVLFMASRWNRDELIEEHHVWYEPDQELRAKLIAGWTQFANDLETFEPTAADPQPVGISPQPLPALRIEVTGHVTASNLDAFKSTALAAIRSVNRELISDQHFANAEASVKWCKEVESRLSAAKELALAQTESIDHLFRTIDDISAEAKQVRLELEKLVKARKDAIRMDIMLEAQVQLTEHVSQINESLGWHNGMPFISVAVANFQGAIKGLKTLSSVREAVDSELFSAKLKATQLGERIQGNLNLLKNETADWKFLFPDLHHVAGKDAQDFANLLAARIATHQCAQDGTAPAPDSAQPEDDEVFIRLGEINARLAPIAITTDGLARLGFSNVTTDKTAKLYMQTDFPRICTALINHIQGVAAASPVTTNAE